LGERANLVRDALAQGGASFFSDLQGATGLGTHALRDALSELAAAGLATNDTLDALRDVARWRPLPPAPGKGQPDPTRWLPAGFTPSPGRPVVQRRPNLRRLPRWRRPDREGGEAPWVGRWSLVHTPGTLGPQASEDEMALAVARQWLDRYGVVARDWWRRERPAVSWRAIYLELKRLEYRGEVRRGYFVRGLAGAQFAVPEAIELLRGAAAREDDTSLEPVVMAASDPANAYALPLDPALRSPLARPRGAGALLVTRGGRVVLTAEARGKRISVAPEASYAAVMAAARALADHALNPATTRRRRDLDVETIDGVPASSSPHAEAFRAAGYRSAGTGLRRYVDF
jgi:ATP-dependent Lhr-like helicase